MRGLPGVGESLEIVGFRAPSASVEMRDDRPAISVNGSMLVCRGTVTAHFLNGRDASMIPWAVTEVDCASWGGMSGGPVFDQHGKLFGILCSSLNDDAGSGTSYVSMLWPALDVPFEGGWPQPWSTGTSSLLSIDERICHIDRRESVVTDVDPKTGARRTYYVRWDKDAFFRSACRGSAGQVWDTQHANPRTLGNAGEH